MKAKKISILMVVFVVMSLLLANTAFAAWFTCTIDKVGAQGVIFVTDTAATPAFTNRWFKSDPTKAKEMLAVALTAYSNGKRLYISLPNPPVQGAQIAGMYIVD